MRGKELRGGLLTPQSLPPSLQIKSDKQQPGVVVYSIKGPGVDEDPKDIFSIDNRSGKVYLNTVLDREKHDRFRVRKLQLDSDQLSIQMFGSPPPQFYPKGGGRKSSHLHQTLKTLHRLPNKPLRGAEAAFPG